MATSTIMLLLILALSAMLTLIAGILAVILQKTPRRIAIDCMLFFATSSCVLVHFGDVVVKKTDTRKGPKAIDVIRLDPLLEVRLQGTRVHAAMFEHRMPEPWRVLSQLEGERSLEDIVANADSKAQKLIERFPDRKQELHAERAKWDDSRTDVVNFERWKQACIGYQSLHLLFALSGIAAIWALIRQPNRLPPADQDAVSITFRAAYACAFCMMYFTIMFSLFFGIVIGIVYGFQAAVHHKPPNMPNMHEMMSTLTVSVQLASALIGAWFIVCRPNKKTFNELFWQDSLRVKNILVYAVLGFLTTSFLMAVVGIGYALFHAVPLEENAAWRQWVEAIITHNQRSFLFCTAFMCVMGPITEEVLFRGIVHRWARRRFGVLAGIAISSLLFGLFHFDLGRLAYYTAAGIVLASLYEKTGSLRVTMLTHIMWNFWALAAMAALVP